MNFELSPKQKNVVENILDWYKSKRSPYITLGGYAGTGKTTLLGHLNNTLHKEYKKISIAYCSFTGKASIVLKKKLEETKSLSPSDYVGTIHRLIYKAIVDEDDNIIGWDKIAIDSFEYDLIIVDEASMVSEEIWNDLLSFHKPILAVGDHGQLPPVEGRFNLMASPMLRLEEIYRQEQGNPIILVSEMARKYGEIPVMDFSPFVKKLNRNGEDVQEFLSEKLSSYDRDMMVLVGYNHTREKLNVGIRQYLEFDSPTPQVEDRVICLRNNAELGIFNGMLGTLHSIKRRSFDDVIYFYDVSIQFDGEDHLFEGNASVEQFGMKDTIKNISRDMNLFDFGYALTVHKAQGSQAEKVILFEERFSKMSDDMWRRWLYTGVTRAVSELYIIGD